MHLRSLSLRNYRVYRELDLEFPDGLIGIYGPNGSGKSSLIESLRFGLYGDSRTDKGELRSADVREDLRVELTFEHEDNTYEVRRRLKGLNLTPEADAAAAEVAERHAAARQAADAAEAARVALEQARADVAAAETAAAALAQARRRAELARAEAERERRASAGHEERAQQADALRGQLQAAERDAGALQAAAAPLDELERARERQLERAAVARALEDARAREADRRQELDQARALAGDQAALAAARAAADQALADADERLAGLRERRESIRQDLGAARARLDAAERAVEQGRALDPAAPCPTCGQPLGEGYAAVRQHRADELAAAGDAHRQVTAALAACEQ